MPEHDAARSLPVPQDIAPPVPQARPTDLMVAGALTLGAFAVGALAAGALNAGRLLLQNAAFARRLPTRPRHGAVLVEELVIARLRMREFVRLPRPE